MAGRRLRDGALIEAPRGNPMPKVAAVVGGIVALATCPTHDSLTSYLTHAAGHPSGYLGSALSVLESVRIALAAESTSWYLFRVGHFRGSTFLGAFGTWCFLPLPSLGFNSAGFNSAAAQLTPTLCRPTSAARPHEAFVVVCVLFHLAWHLIPRFMYRHALCSPRAISEGRLWVILTANFSHARAAHLLGNLLQLLHFGPLMESVLGCERMILLLATSALASSAASLLCSALSGGFGSGRRTQALGSLGASGVTLALVGANAARFPHTAVRMLGMELLASHVLLLTIAIDVLGRGRVSRVDVSAHAGGALCGWYLAKRWAAELPFRHFRV